MGLTHTHVNCPFHSQTLTKKTGSVPLAHDVRCFIQCFMAGLTDSSRMEFLHDCSRFPHSSQQFHYRIGVGKKGLKAAPGLRAFLSLNCHVHLYIFLHIHHCDPHAPVPCTHHHPVGVWPSSYSIRWRRCSPTFVIGSGAAVQWLLWKTSPKNYAGPQL